MQDYECDRCGKPARFDKSGGCCAECGDNLCIACAGDRWWGEGEEEGFYCQHCYQNLDASDPANAEV